MNYTKILTRLRAARIVVASFGVLLCVVVIVGTLVRPETVTLPPVAIVVFFTLGLMRHGVDLFDAWKSEA